MHERRGAVENAGERQGKHRVEALGREAQTSQQGQERPRSGEAHRRPDPHFDDELAHDDERRCVVMGRKLDQPDHQGDSGGVVDAGLSLQRRARASGDLPPAEHQNITAGSVGASAAPMIPASVQVNPSA